MWGCCNVQLNERHVSSVTVSKLADIPIMLGTVHMIDATYMCKVFFGNVPLNINLRNLKQVSPSSKTLFL